MDVTDLLQCKNVGVGINEVQRSVLRRVEYEKTFKVMQHQESIWILVQTLRAPSSWQVLKSCGSVSGQFWHT